MGALEDACCHKGEEDGQQQVADPDWNNAIEVGASDSSKHCNSRSRGRLATSGAFLAITW